MSDRVCSLIFFNYIFFEICLKHITYNFLQVQRQYGWTRILVFKKPTYKVKNEKKLTTFFTFSIYGFILNDVERCVLRMTGKDLLGSERLKRSIQKSYL